MAAKKKVTKPAQKPVKAAAKMIKETTVKSAPFTNVCGASMPDFTKVFTQFKPLSLEMDMFKGNKQMDKIVQDATVMGQEQMDAVMKSSTIWAKGVEEIIKTCVEIAQSSGEKSQSAAKSMMSCKTLNEFTDAQTKLAQSSFDEFMSNATKISEKTVKLMSEAMEPINDQMGKAMKRTHDSMAA